VVVAEDWHFVFVNKYHTNESFCYSYDELHITGVGEIFEPLVFTFARRRISFILGDYTFF
jgi:hypothetical protein